MTEPLQNLPSRTLNLNLDFQLDGDRYRHSIVLQCGSDPQAAVPIKDPATLQPLVIASSIEGTSQDRWPPSPPLQEVIREDRPDHSVYLGVGRAGTAHWSSSFKLEQDSRLVIEHACRVSEAPETALFNSYEIDAAWQITTSSTDSIQLKQGPVTVTITGLDLKLEARQFRASAQAVSISKFPATIVWGQDFQVSIGD